MRIGVITLYNENNNYGGMAQAYALQRYIEKLGHDCEVINYRRTTKTIFGAPIVKRTFLTKVKDKLVWLVENELTKRNKDSIQKRHSAMRNFREMHVPHTKEYTDETIEECVDSFDVFISGSDQIWKPQVIREPFALGFVPDCKPKLSYASSISQADLSEAYGEFMKEHLQSYCSISVREKEAQIYLQNLLSREVEWVTDPVLLLDREDWDCIASDRKYKEKYIFCYLLGDSVSARREAKKYAKYKNLKLITMPYLKGRWRAVDQGLGDVQLFDAGVEDFLSLIKYADCVITDSFHAAVFSYIFQRDFFVFPRVDKGSNENMNSRISSFLGLIGEQGRYVIDGLDYNTESIAYEGKESSALEEKRAYSRCRLSTVLDLLKKQRRNDDDREYHSEVGKCWI